MLHHLTVRSDARGADTYTHAGLAVSVSHATDALSRICRELRSFGLVGAAEVRGTDGRLRFTVPDIERAARRTLREDDADGLRWRDYQPRPAPEHHRQAGGRERQRLPASAM